MNIGKKINKVGLVLAVFLIIPVCALLLDWKWTPAALNQFSLFLFYFTETSGLPWAVFSCLFFSLVFIICLKITSKRKIIKILAILVFAMLSGQVVKSVAKSITEEPRPYVIWIEDVYHIDDKTFYSHSREERKTLVGELLQNSSVIPQWLSQHWQNETGYTFPSGHTLFATTWAFLALLLIGFKRNKVVVTAFICWAVIVGLSRLALGMHYPIDLIPASILASMIGLLSYWMTIKFGVIEPDKE